MIAPMNITTGKDVPKTRQDKTHFFLRNEFDEIMGTLARHVFEHYDTYADCKLIIGSQEI